MATDEELLEAWRAGDGRAGRILVDRHFAAIHRFFVYLVPVGVEDLVQQTFLACVEGRDRFRGEGSFSGWLFGIAHNIFKRYLRKKRGETDSSVMTAHDLALEPVSVVLAKEEERLLLKALRRIPLDYQIALQLHFWEGMTGSAIAANLQMPEGTVRNWLRRGRLELARQMEALTSSPAALHSTLDRLEHWAASIRAQVDARLVARERE